MASEYIEDSSSEDREGYRRGGRGRGGRGSGRGGGRGSGGRGGRGRSSSSKGRGKGKSSSRAGRGAKSSARGKSRSRGAASRSAKASSAKSSAARSSRADSNAASNRSKAPIGRPSMKDIGVTKSFKSPTKQRVSTLDKKKMRSPTAFSPQDVAAAIGRKSLADVKAGEFKSRNAAYKANQAAVDAQKARFKGYAPSKRSDTSAIAGYGGINPKNMGLGVQSAFNTAQNRNETTGMGLLDSVRFQATRPEFKRDVNNLKDIYNKIPTPGNLAMKALGLFGKKPTDATAQVGAQSTGIGSIFDKIKSGFNRSPSTTPQDDRLARRSGDGSNNKMISDMLLRPAVNPGGIDGPFKQPSPTVMPGMENLQQLENRFGNNGIGTLLARAQSTPTSNYGYGPSATAGRENIDRLTAAPSYMPLSSFMTAADGGRAGYSEGGSGTDQQQRENFYDFGYDNFLSLEQYMGSAQAIRDLERNANGGRIGYQYGGTGAYPSGNVYGGNYAQGGQAQSGSPMHGGGYNQGGSPMVMMTGANSGLGNVLEHYKTIRGKM